MRRAWAVGLAGVVLTTSSCRVVDSFRAPRTLGRPDVPGYSIEEQERIGRQFYSIPEDNFRIGPPTGISRPDPVSPGR